ncbi:MAG: TorD/DmsD family molecular chaperone [Desulfatiglandales bacterium]
MKTIDPFLRSTGYREIASWYRYPEQSSIEELKKKVEEIRSAFEALDITGNFDAIKELDGLFDALDGLSLTDLQAEYVRLFDYRPPCPLFESSYTELEKNNPGKVKLSVEDFYNEFGLDASPSSPEPPDHLMLELEFMHFLSFKEGEALQHDGPDIEKYRVAQKRFCKTHLQKWVPAFCERLRDNADQSFFRGLADLTEDFVLQDTDYIEALCRELQ